MGCMQDTKSDSEKNMSVNRQGIDLTGSRPNLSRPTRSAWRDGDGDKDLMFANDNSQSRF